MDEDKRRVRISGYGSENDGTHYVRITGLTKEEKEKMAGFENGYLYISKDNNGDVEFVSKLKELPGPTEDEEMKPFWRKPVNGEAEMQSELFIEEQEWSPFSPSIYIQHLCGYNYTPENYKYEAQKLESFGFECMRSQRKKSGKFWEVWYLPGLWAADGALENHLEKDEDIDEAVSFLCRNCSFGSLSVAVQKAAMTID